MRRLRGLLLSLLLVSCDDAVANLIVPLPPSSSSETCAETECPPERPLCEPSGRCVTCRTMADCADVRAPMCDVEQGECVQCLSDDYCTDEETCNRQLGRCVFHCAQDVDCAQTSALKCSLELSACLQCELDADCGSGGSCYRGECFAFPDSSGG